MTAGNVLRHPIKLLARRLRNGKRTDEGASLDEHLRAEGEVSDKAKETVWYVGEVYQEIWDNEDDAVYDDLPPR